MPHHIDVFQTFDIMVLMETHAALGDVLMRAVQISDCHIIQVTNLFLCEILHGRSCQGNNCRTSGKFTKDFLFPPSTENAGSRWSGFKMKKS